MLRWKSKIQIVWVGLMFSFFFASVISAETLSDNFDEGLSPLMWDKWQWGTQNYIAVKCPDESGRVEVSKPAHDFDGSSKKGGIKSRFILDGDFSIFVDFDLMTFPVTQSQTSYNEGCLAIVSALNDSDTVYCYRWANTAQKREASSSGTLKMGWGSALDKTISGKLGISREGNTLSFHIGQGEGPPFVFASYSHDLFLGPVYITLHIKQSGDPAPTNALDVRYDNLSVTADKIIYRPKIISPAADENIVADSLYEIKWMMPEQLVVEQLALEYTTDGGQSWSTVAIVDGASLSYLWRTPNTNRNHCKVRVRDVSDSLTVDETDEFTIFICYQSIPGDIDGDCYVNFRDIAILLSNWLACGNHFLQECAW